MVALVTAADIQAQIEELTAEAEAIYETAQASEEQKMSDADRERLDEIQGADGTGGLLAELQADLKRARAVETRMAAKLQKKIDNRDVSTPEKHSQPESDDDPFAARLLNVRMPARARRLPLTGAARKAFGAGFEGDKAAYLCGRSLASLLGHEPSTKWLADNGIRNDLSSGSATSAGVLVIGEVSTAIIRLVEEYGNARAQLGSQPMSSNSWSGPVRVSGMTAYPVAETTGTNAGSNTGTKSDPTYKMIEMVARKWKAWTKASDELNDDSYVSLAAQVVVESATAFAYAEDNSAWNGDGSSSFHGINGILNAVKAGSIYTPTAGAGTLAFSDLAMSDFETMVGMLPDFAGIMPVWNISKEGYYASMHRLLMAAGGNTAENLSEGGRPRFLGYDVRFTNVLPKALDDQASTKVLTLGDLSMGGKFGSRQDVELSVSTERFWDEDQIGIKSTERFDINIHSTGSASEAGAILVLQFPAS